MDPARDLGAVANLISQAFAGELDSRAQAVLREMRLMARLWPLVWWWAQADPEFRDTFGGFVWEEPDARRGRLEIVGNASLNRAPGDRQRWIVCNVAVRPEWRRQGIARRLIQAAVAEARQRGAAGVVLQAYQENPAAVRLYAGLGFQEVAGETSLRLEAPRSVALQAAPGYTIRAWRPSDGPAGYELARQVLPAALQWMEPPRAEQYRPDAWQRLAQRARDALAGRRTHRLVAWQGERLAALLTVRSAGREPAHRVQLLVARAHWGSVEQALVSRALGLLAALPPRPVWASVDKEHRAARDALHRLGFEERQTLLIMKVDFRP
jgi:ribosomal protein S18 acetylase RimI-like enzyme